MSEILHELGHYIVPLFQRSYSWHKEHWQRLNDDVMALADDAERQVHFLRPLVCTCMGEGADEWLNTGTTEIAEKWQKKEACM